MTAAVSILLGLALLCFTWPHWRNLQKGLQVPVTTGPLPWLAKGVFVPLLVWVWGNTGWFFGFPPLSYEVAVARAGPGQWGWALLQQLCLAVPLVISLWSAVTLGWLVTVLCRDKRHRARLIRRLFFWGLVLSPCAWFALPKVGAHWVAVWVTLWLIPVVRQLAILPLCRISPSVYAQALINQREGQCERAEWQIIEALERCSDDFEGWMLLADLYASEFHDLPAAEQTVRDLCDAPQLTPSQVAMAMNRLADWHLNLAKDPAAARSALEEIIRRLPGTYAARLAAHRLSRLPASRRELQEDRMVRMLMPSPSTEDLDIISRPSSPGFSLEEAAGMANCYAARLRQEPNDILAREEYARVMADCLDEPEVAIDQLEVLLELGGQEAGRRAQWMLLIGVWQIRYRRDRQAGGDMLRLLIKEYPGSRQAAEAQRHLCLLDVQDRIKATCADGSLS